MSDSHSTTNSPQSAAKTRMDLSKLPPHLKVQILSILQKNEGQNETSREDSAAEPDIDEASPPTIIDLSSVKFSQLELFSAEVRDFSYRNTLQIMIMF